MPPDRDNEIIIELLSGTTHIAKMSYIMEVNELEELKKQLKELQEKDPFTLVLYLGGIRYFC